ncbi:MAG: dihydrodipicolinate synthase family protein [Bacteroidales bacterium]|jgi:N-acetylneuraminate lyase|nr:dihydrodipicolinate synthase family protein [Bacteroidales bacterium]
MAINKVEGLIAAPFTPMHPDGEVNPDLIEKYHSMLSSNGVVGAFINGSTGEGVSTTLREKLVVSEAWAKANSGGEIKVINHLGGTCYKECMELAKESEKMGLYAVALTSPSYFKPANAKMLAEYFIRVASSVPEMPVYYYHIPVLTGGYFNMIDFVREVAPRVPNFAGIKFTHEDFMDFLSCLNYEGGKYDMLWGRDENFLSAMVLGARGAVGSTYNYAAPLYIKMIEAFDRNDTEEARSLQQKSIDMITLLGKYGGIATGKAYMRFIGLECGEFRLPVRNMSRSDYDSFVKDVKSLGMDDLFSKLA